MVQLQRPVPASCGGIGRGPPQSIRPIRLGVGNCAVLERRIKGRIKKATDKESALLFTQLGSCLLSLKSIGCFELLPVIITQIRARAKTTARRHCAVSLLLFANNQDNIPVLPLMPSMAQPLKYICRI
jgi:hypothetical protein